MIWFLMTLDAISFLLLSLAHFEFFFTRHFLFVSAGYLISKAFIFQDIMSFIDAVAGIYIFLVAIFALSTPFYFFIFGWFAYKLVFTILSF